jgi:hypothetical protein
LIADLWVGIWYLVIPFFSNYLIPHKHHTINSQLPLPKAGHLLLSYLPLSRPLFQHYNKVSRDYLYQKTVQVNLVSLSSRIFMFISTISSHSHPSSRYRYSQIPLATITFYKSTLIPSRHLVRFRVQITQSIHTYLGHQIPTFHLRTSLHSFTIRWLSALFGLHI